jgi:hypothetical protein
VSEFLCYILNCPKRVSYVTLSTLLSWLRSLSANDQIFKEIANLHFKLLAQELPARQ